MVSRTCFRLRGADSCPPFGLCWHITPVLYCPLRRARRGFGVRRLSCNAAGAAAVYRSPSADTADNLLMGVAHHHFHVTDTRRHFYVLSLEPNAFSTRQWKCRACDVDYLITHMLHLTWERQLRKEEYYGVFLTPPSVVPVKWLQNAVFPHGRAKIYLRRDQGDRTANMRKNRNGLQSIIYNGRTRRPRTVVS